MDGRSIGWSANPDAIGRPAIRVILPPGERRHVTIVWGGRVIKSTPCAIDAAVNELNVIDLKHDVIDIHDPQRLVDEQEISDAHVQVRLTGTPGERTFFARLRRGEMTWWQPVHVHLGRAVEVIPGKNESAGMLEFRVRNNSERPLKGTLAVNPGVNGEPGMELRVPPKVTSGIIRVPAGQAVKGTNVVRVCFSGKDYDERIVNWELPFSADSTCPVEMTPYFNEHVIRIFGDNKYLSPRSPWTTLQLPARGLGEWCHPLINAHIDDSGLRAMAVNYRFTTPFGLTFATPRDSVRPNVAFVSLWDNYPEYLRVPLSGLASRAYFLMAGTTHHMQSQFENGTLSVHYRDGSADTLSLRNPETWAPIERDYYVDGYAFSMRQARPYRVVLKSGHVARDLDPVIANKALDQRYIDGGGAIILDLPLDPGKELDYLSLAATANDVVIGLIAVTLVR